MKSRSNSSPVALREPAQSARRKFSADFKLAAVTRLRQGDKAPMDLALELGIRRNQLYKWAKQLDQGSEQPFRAPGRPVEQEICEVKRLQKQLAKAQQELEILKKFDAYLTRLKR